MTLMLWMNKRPSIALKIDLTSTTMNSEVCLALFFLEPIEVFKVIMSSAYVAMLEKP